MFLRRDHHRSTVGVVRAHRDDFVALHALKSHPKVSQKVLHQMPDMNAAIGVGESGSD